MCFSQDHNGKRSPAGGRTAYHKVRGTTAQHRDADRASSSCATDACWRDRRFWKVMLEGSQGVQDDQGPANLLSMPRLPARSLILETHCRGGCVCSATKNSSGPRAVQRDSESCLIVARADLLPCHKKCTAASSDCIQGSSPEVTRHCSLSTGAARSPPCESQAEKCCIQVTVLPCFFALHFPKSSILRSNCDCRRRYNNPVIIVTR